MIKSKGEKYLSSCGPVTTSFMNSPLSAIHFLSRHSNLKCWRPAHLFTQSNSFIGLSGEKSRLRASAWIHNVQFFQERGWLHSRAADALILHPPTRAETPTNLWGRLDVTRSLKVLVMPRLPQLWHSIWIYPSKDFDILTKNWLLLKF